MVERGVRRWPAETPEICTEMPAMYRTPKYYPTLDVLENSQAFYMNFTWNLSNSKYGAQLLPRLPRHPGPEVYLVVSSIHSAKFSTQFPSRNEKHVLHVSLPLPLPLPSILPMSLAASQLANSPRQLNCINRSYVRDKTPISLSK